MRKKSLFFVFIYGLLLFNSLQITALAEESVSRYQGLSNITTISYGVYISGVADIDKDAIEKEVYVLLKSKLPSVKIDKKNQHIPCMIISLDTSKNDSASSVIYSLEISLMGSGIDEKYSMFHKKVFWEHEIFGSWPIDEIEDRLIEQISKGINDFAYNWYNDDEKYSK